MMGNEHAGYPVSRVLYLWAAYNHTCCAEGQDEDKGEHVKRGVIGCSCSLRSALGLLIFITHSLKEFCPEDLSRDIGPRSWT